jgi:hypothetical protein
MSYPSQKEFAQQLRSLQTGMDADLTGVDSVILGEVEYSIPELRAKVDEFLAAQERLRIAENMYQAALAAHRTSRAAAETFRGQLQAYVVCRHGKSHTMLLKYGFSPEKPRKISAATKTLSALRGNATRNERGTVSKKQRARMPKGKVDEIAVAKLLGSGESKKTAGDGSGKTKKT